MRKVVRRVSKWVIEVMGFAEKSLEKEMRTEGKAPGAPADFSQCNAYLCRACSIQINSWWPSFLLHKDGFPPFSASGGLDMPTFHVIIFPNWWLNDFFPLSIIISWRKEIKTLVKTFNHQKKRASACFLLLIQCYTLGALLQGTLKYPDLEKKCPV